MKEWGLRWRNHFYETILGTVLATASEFSYYRDNTLQIPATIPFPNLNVSYGPGTSTASATIPPTEFDAPPLSTYSPQTSSASKDDVSYCPHPSCKASFTGSSQRTNLQRHLKFALHHNQDALFECGLCHKTISRTDNLQQHLRNIHGLDPALKRQRTSKSPKRKDRVS